ncbi:hypothetical protein KL919_004738 [Ogataea angusta]|nr:hypothetical protein KL943_004748 [Ogataea angusta]KAG7855598.1 hypothetical protein KL919_004738 [Ogataea angusta]
MESLYPRPNSSGPRKKEDMEVSPPQPEFHSPAMDRSTHLDVDRSSGRQRSMPLDSTPSESTLREIACRVRSIGRESGSTEVYILDRAGKRFDIG